MYCLSSEREKSKVQMPAQLAPSQGESVPGLSPWLAGDCLHPHMLPSPCKCLSPNSPFYKATRHMGVGPTLLTHFNFIASVIVLSPNEVTCRGSGG